MSIPAIAPVLLACLHRDPSRLDPASLSRLSADDWQALRAYAGYHRVRPLLHRRLNAADVKPHVPPAVLHTLSRLTRSIVAKNLRGFGELTILIQDMHAAGIEVMLLKGAHLALHVYGDAGLREMLDVDLLVRPRHLDAAFDIVRSRGYTASEEPHVAAEAKARRHAPRLVRRGVLVLEIHSSLTSPTEPYAADPEGLWRRASRSQFGGCQIRTLSPEDLLLHLAMHAAYQHTFEMGLRPLCDISVVIDHTRELDWTAVIERAVTLKWDRGTYATLQLAAELVGAAVPGTVLAALRPQDGDAGIAAARSATLTSRAVLMCANIAKVADDSLPARMRHLVRRALLIDVQVSPAYLRLGRARRIWARLTRPVRLLRTQGLTVATLALGTRGTIVEAARRKNEIRKYLRADAGRPQDSEGKRIDA